MYNGYCSANGYYAAAGGGRETSGAGSLPTGNTATPGAVATGGRSSPTGLPGTSSASSLHSIKSAALILCLAFMVSCFHRHHRHLLLRLAIGSYVLTLHLGCGECHLYIVTGEGLFVMKRDSVAGTEGGCIPGWRHVMGGGMSWAAVACRVVRWRGRP